MMARMPGAVVAADPITATRSAVIPALRLDTLVLHAQRADESGNVQIIGPRALDLAMAGAARKVLVTVEETVPVGTLSRDGRQTVLTRNQVSAIAVAPGGAWPASCLPFYVTDYAALSAAFAGGEPLLESLALPVKSPSPSGFASTPRPLRGGEEVRAKFATFLSPHRWGRVPNAVGRRGGRPDGTRSSCTCDRPRKSGEHGCSLPKAQASSQRHQSTKSLLLRIAAELGNDSFASAGAVSPLANVAYRLAKATHAPDMIIATMSAAISTSRRAR